MSRLHHRARLCRSVEEFEPTRRVEQIGDALHRRGRRGLAEQPDDRVRMADAGQAPRANQSLGDEPFKNRADMFDKRSVKRHPHGGGGPSRAVVRIGYDIRMQEEQIEPVEVQPTQASLDRAAQNGLDLAGRRLAQIALAGDPHPIWQPSGKSCADDLFGLAVAIARRQVEQVDAGLDRRMHGRDTFLECGLAPHHAEPAAAQESAPKSATISPIDAAA